MASADEMAEAICTMLEFTSQPIPITLMNQSVDEAAATIGAIVERCFLNGLVLSGVRIDPELIEALLLIDGSPLPHGSKPIVRCQPGLGRHVIFEKAT